MHHLSTWYESVSSFNQAVYVFWGMDASDDAPMVARLFSAAKCTRLRVRREPSGGSHRDDAIIEPELEPLMDVAMRVRRGLLAKRPRSGHTFRPDATAVGIVTPAPCREALPGSPTASMSAAHRNEAPASGAGLPDACKQEAEGGDVCGNVGDFNSTGSSSVEEEADELLIQAASSAVSMAEVASIQAAVPLQPSGGGESGTATARQRRPVAGVFVRSLRGQGRAWVDEELHIGATEDKVLHCSWRFACNAVCVHAWQVFIFMSLITERGRFNVAVREQVDEAMFMFIWRITIL
jgi:hypothetical protein